ncbi:MAG: glycosyltransferase, partial [Verrucomicrobiota bacterium]|nr:glycosyltransferase [Verrucomicrobiota bacterium]
MRNLFVYALSEILGVAFIFFVFTPPLVSREKTICLSMIVKDQESTIKTCLRSVKSFIDTWVIVDVGSTDGTRRVIEEELKNIPGELVERPWKSFGENREEALQLARPKGDYLLLLDADEQIIFASSFEDPLFDQDIYFAWRGTKHASSITPLLVRSSLPAKWVGYADEYFHAETSFTSDVLIKLRCLVVEGGMPGYAIKKAWQKVKLLEKWLKEHPSDPRFVFALAENYREAGELGKALECYQKRIQLGGWVEEVFCSMLQSAHMLKALGLSSDIVLLSYQQAHHFRPHRPDGVFYLSEWYNQLGRYEEACACIENHANLPKPKNLDILCYHNWVDEYGLLFQHSICAYYVGKYATSLNLCDRLLLMA